MVEFRPFAPIAFAARRPGDYSCCCCPPSDAFDCRVTRTGQLAWEGHHDDTLGYAIK